jgi:uncharacterized protein
VKTESANEIKERTKNWVEKAVIGLNLCPFAKAVYATDKVRYFVSPATNAEELAADLITELQHLNALSPDVTDTTLVIHPNALLEFLDFNDFLDVADAAIDELGLTSEFQIASFHPQYQFEGTDPEDIENYTNRAPYPILQLLRESSVEKGLSAFADPDEIFKRNIETMRRLGHEGWKNLKI